MKKMNNKKIEKAVKLLLEAVCDDPNREGLLETPKRVAKMYNEVLEGMCYTNEELIKMFDKQFEMPTSNNMVVVSNIPIFSFCEHHLMLMYDIRAHIAYIPKDKVLGLSKVARIVDMVAKRLQLQERICEDTAYIMKQILKTDNVAVVIEGKHGCVSARGIKKVDSVTHTEVLDGQFKTDNMLINRFYSLIEKRG